jgi:putative ABC transport system ATP-binding protein
VIWLEGVSYLRAGGPVLEDATLGVSCGELVVVQGPTGSGKSSLLAVAAGVRAPDSGAVWIAERNIAGLQASSLPYVRRNIGYLPPEPLLIPDETVLENIMLALAVRGESVDAAEADARETLAMVADSAWEGRLARSLSTGQQRLIALARALVGPPPLVVVDEPAAGLGGDDREGIVGALVWARDRGCAVLCATSDPSFAQMLVDEGGRRVLLEGGRMAGGPAIGLVPTVHLADMGTLEGFPCPPAMVRGEQSSPAPHATSEGEPEDPKSAEAIRSSDRRSSGEESS